MCDKPKLETGEVLVWPYEITTSYLKEHAPNLLSVTKSIQAALEHEIEYIKEQGYTNISYPTAETMIQEDGTEVVLFRFIIFATPPNS